MNIRSVAYSIGHKLLLFYAFSLGALLSAPCYGALESSENLEISIRAATLQDAHNQYRAYFGVKPRANTSLTGIGEEPFAEDFSDDPEETNVNITMTRRTEGMDVKTHFDANYHFTPDQSDPIDQSIRVNEFYLDTHDNDNSVSTRIGRQDYKIAGATGRVDGISMGYRLFKRQKMNLIAGYTRDPATVDNLENDGYLYGINIDSGRFAKRWQADLYALERTNRIGSSQQVMGSRLHYLHPAHPALLTVDINPENDELNNANLRFDLKLPYKNSLHFKVDYCKPVAGLAQATSSLNELLSSLPPDESQLLEQEPSGMFRSTGISWSTQFSSNTSLSSETSFASLDRFAPSGISQTLNQRYFGIEFIRKDVSRPDTSSRLSFRYLDRDLENHMILSFHNRFIPYRSWLADFLVEADWQKQKDQSRAMSLNPSLRFLYQDKGKNTLEVELGMKPAEVASLTDPEQGSDLYLRITHNFPL